MLLTLSKSLYRFFPLSCLVMLHKLGSVGMLMRPKQTSAFRGKEYILRFRPLKLASFSTSCFLIVPRRSLEIDSRDLTAVVPQC